MKQFGLHKAWYHYSLRSYYIDELSSSAKCPNSRLCRFKGWNDDARRHLRRRIKNLEYDNHSLVLPVTT